MHYSSNWKRHGKILAGSDNKKKTILSGGKNVAFVESAEWSVRVGEWCGCSNGNGRCSHGMDVSKRKGGKRRRRRSSLGGTSLETAGPSTQTPLSLVGLRLGWTHDGTNHTPSSIGINPRDRYGYYPSHYPYPTRTIRRTTPCEFSASFFRILLLLMLLLMWLFGVDA